MTNEQLADRLQLFYGGASPNVATIYARLPDQRTAEGLTLAGFVRGPHCLYSTMLPATIRLADAGPGDSLLSRVVLPDPCYWTEQLPALYDVHVELKQGSETLATTDRTLGLRQFGGRGRFFYQNGKRWTIRAAQPSATPAELLEWHDTPLSVLVDQPSDAFCDEASRIGVLVLAQLQGEIEVIIREVTRLARQAAVAVITVPLDRQRDVAGLRQIAPNVAWACVVDGNDSGELTSGYDAAILRFSTIEAFARQAAAISLPIIAWRGESSSHDSPAAARAACDALQAELAPLGDFAGYVV